MLVFSAHITNPTPGCCPSRKAIDGVEPFLVRPAVIINHRLPKVIAVCERLSGDCCNSRVNRFDAPAKTSVAAPSFDFVAEFRFEQAIYLLRLRPTSAFSIYGLGSFLQEANALIARPRLHPFESAINQTHGCQAVKSRIDPAIQGDIGRALVRWRVRSIAPKDLADRSPFPAAEFRIVMPAVNVLRNEITHHAANDHVRRKVSMSLHAGDANQRGQAISHYLGEWTGIFVGDDSCNGPCSCRMPRGEGGATALKKRSAAIALIGAFPSQRILQPLHHHQTVQGSFAREEASLTPVLVVFHVTQHPHSSGPADKCGHAGVRKRFVVADGCGTLRQVFAEIAVRHEKSGRDTTERNKPLGVRKAEFCRARPNLSLVTQEILG